MDENELKLIYRLKNISDGKDFIDFLIKLSLENYRAWKHEGGDVLRGKAIALDELIALFQNIELKIGAQPSIDNWA